MLRAWQPQRLRLTIVRDAHGNWVIGPRTLRIERGSILLRAVHACREFRCLWILARCCKKFWAGYQGLWRSLIERGSDNVAPIVDRAWDPGEPDFDAEPEAEPEVQVTIIH